MSTCPFCGLPGPPFEHIDCFVAMSREMSTEAFQRTLVRTVRDDIASGNVWPEEDDE